MFEIVVGDTLIQLKANLTLPSEGVETELGLFKSQRIIRGFTL